MTRMLETLSVVVSMSEVSKVSVTVVTPSCETMPSGSSTRSW